MARSPREYPANIWGTAEHRVYHDLGGVVVDAFDSIPPIDSEAPFTAGGDGYYAGAEQDTPPAGTAGFWYIGSDSNERLWFVDGAGAEHTLHFDALGELSYHSPTGTDAQAITRYLWTKLTSFDAIGSVDDQGNVTGSTSTNDLTVGANVAGIYLVSWGVSGTVATQASDFAFAAAIELATARTITDASSADPIVITTAAAHGFVTGDGVEQANVGGNTAANGSFLIDVQSPTTYDLYDTAKVSVAFSGGYTTGGTVDWHIPRQSIAWRTVGTSNIGDFGRTAEIALAAGDKVFTALVNIDNNNDFVVHAANVNIRRRAD